MIVSPAVRPGSKSSSFDVLVVGAGAIGLVLGIGLARAGFATAVIGPAALERPGRTVALLDGSVRLLEQFGLWSALAPEAAGMRAMRIVDATGSLFRAPPVTFRAADIGLDVFGFNVQGGLLEASLRRAAEAQVGLTLDTGLAADCMYGQDRAVVTLADGAQASAPLLIAADGRQSLARKQAGIGVRVRTYPQVALTALLSHRAPHDDISTEFHTRKGPCTLVPLPAAGSQPNRSSLVWVMDPVEAKRRRNLGPADLAIEIERQSDRLLGPVVVESPLGAFPIATSVSRRLVGNRLALTGEAAHALPPIGAQGMNLSLRDVDRLVSLLIDARGSQQDIGSPAVLERYTQSRAGDVGLRALGVDLLNGSLLAHNPIADAVRGTGLNLLDASGPLRRWVMRQGLAPDRSPTPMGR